MANSAKSPVWVEDLAKLQDEYVLVKGKTFHSSWDDFLFCRLQTVKQQRQVLADALAEAREFIENQQLPDAEWSRVLDVVVAALAKAEGKSNG